MTFLGVTYFEYECCEPELEADVCGCDIESIQMPEARVVQRVRRVCALHSGWVGPKTAGGESRTEGLSQRTRVNAELSHAPRDEHIRRK